MKRREFLTASAGLAGVLLPVGGLAQSSPCDATTAEREREDREPGAPCTAVDPEADWRSRTSGAGVVWFHDFRDSREVDAFRWLSRVGNDPDSAAPLADRVRRITTDGVTGGGCMEIWRDGKNDVGGWWRPFSPLTGGWPGNGKAQDDPGARDARHIVPRPWDPTADSRFITRKHQHGYYAHPDYHGLHPAQYDGVEYYLQVRVKVDPNRLKYRNGGKLFYFTRTDRSATDQEIVTVSGRAVGGRNMFSMYRTIGSPLHEDWEGHGNQPGSELRGRFGGLCNFGYGGLRQCWSYSGGWDTLLYHIRPGLNRNGDTLVQVWAAHPGEQSYTKIWDQPNVNLPFDQHHPRGHNALICSGYLNRIDTGPGIYHRYAQIIFSLDWIECPPA